VTRGAPMVLLAALVAASTACAGPTTSKPAPPPSSGAGRTASTTTTRVDPAQAARLQRIMVPLIRVMDHPIPLDQVKVGIMDDQQINAANAGGDQFFVTTGLLHKANDDRLRAVLAHELSHQDLNHVAKAQVLAAGLGIGAAILDQIFPGTGAITPLAGQLVTSQYSRSEEYAADAHGVVLLRRAGYPKEMMIDTLTWLLQVSGPGSGGFFATHPGAADRIDAVRKMP
jgi:predicted Zn-dependent protease